MSETQIAAQIPSNVGRAAAEIALREIERRERLALVKAARKAAREHLQKTDAYQRANELKAEMRTATFETRKEIAEYTAEAKRDPDYARLQAEVDVIADRARTLDGLVAHACQEYAQTLLPFAREVVAT